MHAITMLLFRTRLLRFRQLYKEMPCAVRFNLGGPSSWRAGLLGNPMPEEEALTFRVGKKPSLQGIGGSGQSETGMAPGRGREGYVGRTHGRRRGILPGRPPS